MKYFVGLDRKYVLLGLAAISLALYAVTLLATRQVDPASASRKLAVSRKLLLAQDVLRQTRARLGLPLSADDRLQTGWIGTKASILTTDPGSLPAKISVTNPNFGAVVLDLLTNVGVRQGDTVAIGMTGSFPALDAAVIMAAEELGAQPVIISSVGASQWGANEPGFTWPVMERALYMAHLIHSRSVAISRGGSRSLPLETIDALETQARASGLPYLDDRHLSQSIRQHMALYQEAATGKRIAAFVNVGGAVVNVGIQGSQVNAADVSTSTGILGSFQALGIPTVDLRKIRQLCRQYNLPWNPAAQPPVGAGTPFRHGTPAVLIVLCFFVQIATLVIAARRCLVNSASLQLGEVIPAAAPDEDCMPAAAHSEERP